MSKYIAAPILTLVACLGLFAKRIPPPRVASITKDGITYTATGDGETEYVVATDANGKEVWRAKVFHVRIKPFTEADVQWIYIAGMKLSGSALLIRDEAARCYRLDLTSKSVRKDKCTEYLRTKP